MPAKPDSPPDLDETRRRVQLTLKKLRPAARHPDECFSFKPEPDVFPVPSLVRFTLHHVLGLPTYGPYEKMRWGIPFEYDGAFFSFELRKFGLTVLTEGDAEDSPRTQEMMGKVAKSIRIVERHLDGIAERKVNDGHVTVENRYHYLDGAYRFLRDRAKEAYVQPEPEAKVVRDGAGKVLYTTCEMWKGEREGGYLATAMLNAYFSRVEHLLVLTLPFTDLATGNGEILKFIGSNWSNKMRMLFDLENEPSIKKLHDRLKHVRDTLRNPLTHGCFESGASSLYFHLEGAGAIPMRMTRYKDGFHFTFYPIAPASFEESCRLFDEFDLFLEGGPLRFGVRWAKSGLNVAYDDANRCEYKAHMTSLESFEKYIERECYLHDYHANMDY